MRRICYYPELVKVAGSVTSALLMSQLEFWFKATGGKSFYKFLEPCQHELYRTGDSWQEELGMSVSEIRSAFKRIGVMYKSKSSFKASTDVFQGKLYAAYYDRIRRTTHYFRNDEKVVEVLGKVEELHQEAKNGSCTQVKNQEEGKSKSVSSVSDKMQDGLFNKDYNKDINQRSIQDDSKELEEIRKLYNKYLGEPLGFKKNLNLKEQKQIASLWQKENGNLEAFESCFRKVAASAFLCGRLEGKKWRASLGWMMKECNFTKIQSGYYDDFIKERQEDGVSPKVQAFNRMYSHDWDFEEIERLERLYIDDLISGQKVS